MQGNEQKEQSRPKVDTMILAFSQAMLWCAVMAITSINGWISVIGLVGAGVSGLLLVMYGTRKEGRKTFVAVGSITLIAFLALLAGFIARSPLPGPHSTLPGPSFEPYFAELDRLPWGATAFNVPDEMRYDETKHVEVVVSVAHSVTELQNMLEGAPGRNIKITPTMTAKLVGDSFQISEATPPTQAIAKDGATRWLWNITPKTGMYDTQLVTLSLWAYVDMNGREVAREIRTFKHEVEVQITPFERAAGFMGTNWQYFAGILTAVGAWWAKRRWFPDLKPAA
jgi:hypothetical protein